MTEQQLGKFLQRHFGRCYVVSPDNQPSSRWPIMRWGDAPWCWKLGKDSAGWLTIYELEASYWYRHLCWGPIGRAFASIFGRRGK